MGDRTSVTLSFLESQQDEALKHFDSDADEAWCDEPIAYHRFEEVNYGTLDFLDKLKVAGIAYESEWDSGNNFGPGVKSVRFTADGEVVEKEVYNSECSIDVHDLMALLDKPEELKNLITSTHQAVSVLSWENQEEYGQRYRARQLIST
jgi:hypothetical protein